MKIIGAFAIIILAIVLCIIVCRIVCWMFDFDKRTDVKMFGREIEDYDNDKQCAIAGVIVAFVMLTVMLLISIFSP